MTSLSTPIGRVRPYLTTTSYYLTFILFGALAALTGPALPELARRTNSSLNAISVILVSRSLGYLLGSLYGGRLYDRLPGHRMLFVMLLTMASMMALMPVMPLLGLLAAILLVLGLAEGALDVGCNSLLMWLHGDKVSPFMNGLHAFFGLGAFISPAIVAQVTLATGNLNWAFWMFALLAVPVAFRLASLPSPTRKITTETRADVKGQASLIALIVLFFGLYVGAEVGYGNWIYTYALRLNLANTETAAYLTSGFWGAFTLGRLLGIGIATRAKTRLILYVDLIGCLGSLGLILCLPGSIPALWVGTLGTGLFMASIFPTMLAYAEEHITLTGKVNGWFLFGGGSGSMVLPWLVGQLIEPVGAQVAMLIFTLDVALNLIVLILLEGMSRKHRKS